MLLFCCVFFFFSSRRRHTRCYRDWSSDVCSSDLALWVRAALYTLDAEITGIVKRRVAVRLHERKLVEQDRKSTRLNSSHGSISYAVFCLKKKKKKKKKEIKKR